MQIITPKVREGRPSEMGLTSHPSRPKDLALFLRQRAYHREKRSSALVIVLIFITLLTVVILAFLSHSIFNGLISGASVNVTKTDLYGHGAINQILGDLKQEIVAGSTSTTNIAGTVKFILYRPTAVANAVPSLQGLYTAANWNTIFPNLIKESTHGIPFYPATYDANAPTRAAALSTTSESSFLAPGSSSGTSFNGRYVSAARWNKVLLLPKASATINVGTGGNATTITADSSTSTTPVNGYYAPDWILTTADGSNITATTTPDTTSSLTTSNVNSKSPKYVIGRYAYAIYNEGGLLDANVAGCPSPTTASFSATGTVNLSRKGPAAFADLTQLPGIASLSSISPTRPQQVVDSLVGWRQSGTLQAHANGLTTPSTFPIYSFNSAASDGYFNYLLGLSTSFMSVANPSLDATGNDSDRIFTSRQQLISFFQNTVAQNTTEQAYLQDAMMYLGTFSRTLNQPSYWPDPSRPVETLPAGFSLAMWTNRSIPANYANQNVAAAYTEAALNTSFRANAVKTAGFTNFDGTAAAIGDPIQKKRFALNRLAWITPYGPIASSSTTFAPGTGPIVTYLENTCGLTQNFLQEGTAANIQMYFGLTWTPGPDSNGLGGYWTYVNNNPTFLTTYIVPYLSYVASPVKSEPDFFELLQNAVKMGGIAVPGLYDYGSSSTSAYTQDRDVEPIYQILQIGANMIDQVNPTQYPTHIQFTLSPGVTADVFGTTDLPYFYGYKQIGFITSVPSGTPGPANSDVLTNPGGNACMAVPIIWNPYDTNSAGWNGQNSSTGTGLAPSAMQLTVATAPVVGATNSYYPWGIQPMSDDSGTLSQPCPTNSTEAPIWTEANNYYQFNNSPSLYRDPTALLMTNIPSGSALTTGPGNSIYQEAATGSWFTGFPMGTNVDRWTANGTTYTVNYIQLSNPAFALTFRVKYKTPGGNWITYQQYYVNGDQDNLFIPYSSTSTQTVLTPMGSSYWDVGGTGGQWVQYPVRFLYDPRSDRFGCPYGTWVGAFAFLNTNTATVRSARPGATPGYFANNFYSGYGWYPPSTVTCAGETEQNISSSGGTYYVDGDGVVRRAMAGYTGVDSSGNATNSSGAQTTINLPLAATITSTTSTGTFTPTANQPQSRPVILHRPFRSVAELGYTFTGTPWRNIDFFTPESAYSALLDTFCVNEDYRPDAVSAGRVDLNTKQAPVIQALLAGAYRDEEANMASPPAVALGNLTTSEATAIAQDLVTRTTVGGTNPNGNPSLTGAQPLANIADLVGRWTDGTGTTTPIIGATSYDGFSADLGNYIVGTPGSNLIERFRETTMRALSDAGQAGTWNLLIDVVAQSGRYPASARTLADFLVEGERHYWVHVAIDRQTGRIIDENIEVVNE